MDPVSPRPPERGPGPSPAPPDRAHLPGGGQIGPYRLEGEIGRGGMGVVFRAHDERLDRDVALKFLPAHLAEDERAKTRLKAEARAAATLDHPHICTIYEVGETEAGRPFIAMACYEGETLKARLQEGALDVDEATRLGRQIADGLAAAHARGIVHRDLKPGNVFLTQRGNAKILDFGVAKIPGLDLTQTGYTPGTIEYGAPEQAQGRVDARSDVWGLGVVLYEMLTGVRPFAADYEAAVLYAILNEDPPPPSTHDPAIPRWLDAVVLRCLEKDPEARFASARAVADALVPPQPPTTPATDPARPAGTGRLMRAAVAVAGILLVGVLAWMAWPSGPTGGLPSELHLAVIPPITSPDGPDDQALAAGLAARLASGLDAFRGGARDLWVVPVSEVRAARVESASEARLALGVNFAVTGSLQRQGDRVTLTLDLVDTRTSRAVASRTIPLGVAQLHRLGTEALVALADMLGLSVPEADAVLADSGTDDPEAWRLYEQGVGYLQRDESPQDLGRAITRFEEALEVDSLFAQAQARLGEAYLRSYETTRDSAWVPRAEAAARRAVRLDAGEPLVHVTQSLYFRTVGEYPLAVQAAREALELDSLSADGLRALARAQEQLGDTDAAEATFRRALAARPGLWIGHTDLGYFYERRGRYADAEASFTAAIELAPENAYAYLGRGAMRQQQSRVAFAEADSTRGAAFRDAAWADYERVVELRDDGRVPAQASSNLAAMALAGGDGEDALEHALRAVETDSTLLMGWNNLAGAYSALDRMPEHRAALRGAIRQVDARLAVNPRDAEVLSSRATYLATLDDPAARADAIAAAALAPNSANILFNAAYVLAQLGDPEAALGYAVRAVRAGFPRDYIDTADVFSAMRELPGYEAL